VNSNAPETQVARIFEENDSYYLLGYQPTYPVDDGHIRRLEIRVARKDVTVHPSSRSFKAAIPQRTKTAVRATTRALAGLIPQSDLPLWLNVAAFAAPPPAKTPTVAVTLGVAAERDDESTEPQTINIEVRVFDPEGRKQFDSATHEVELVPGAPTALYDVVSRFDLKPGRYSVRASAHSVSRDRSGSVYADVTVPDFAKERLSLSHIAVSSARSNVAPAKAVDGVLPVLPTTRREFARGENVEAIALIYQGGKGPPVAAELHARILDANSQPVFERREAIDPSAFGPSGAYEYRLTLPAGRLEPGEYVLHISVAGSPPAVGRRDVRFRIAEKP
jgi:hypothetical protein